MTSKDKGDALENRVVRLYKNLGHLFVRKNVILKDYNGNISQIDVRAGPPFLREYIECKNYTGSVPLEAVAKFKGNRIKSNLYASIEPSQE